MAMAPLLVLQLVLVTIIASFLLRAQSQVEALQLKPKVVSHTKAVTKFALSTHKNVPGCVGNDCPAGPTQILPTWDDAWASEMRKDAVQNAQGKQQGESDLVGDDGPIKKKVIARRQAAARWSILMWVTFFLVVTAGLLFAFWDRMVVLAGMGKAGGGSG